MVIFYIPRLISWKSTLGAWARCRHRRPTPLTGARAIRLFYQQPAGSHSLALNQVQPGCQGAHIENGGAGGTAAVVSITRPSASRNVRRVWGATPVTTTSVVSGVGCKGEGRGRRFHRFGGERSARAARKPVWVSWVAVSVVASKVMVERRF